MYQDYPKRIKALRRSQEISQAKMAEELDISERTYRDIEHGILSPRVDLLSKIAQQLGTTASDLLR
ncbi:helix-turn-helix transcriptional regulator [Dysosmobacter sp. Sow4_B12]|uniref:helix-turn-helix transcriptional regulator n=1 Tax=Dysosmobacter sp. Sow4_B12 TaxID=3438777 RepID=UPI003F929322